MSYTITYAVIRLIIHATGHCRLHRRGCSRGEGGDEERFQPVPGEPNFPGLIKGWETVTGPVERKSCMAWNQ